MGVEEDEGVRFVEGEGFGEEIKGAGVVVLEVDGKGIRRGCEEGRGEKKGGEDEKIPLDAFGH